MQIATWVVIAVLAAAATYLVLIYNNLVRLKHNVAAAWSNIDVLLKQRHDELPKLVETCKQYMGFERDTLERVMRARRAVSEARERGDIEALGGAETQLRQGLMNLFAVAEAYPDLKANESFRHLEARITGLENAIADRREYYNDSVNINNIRIEQFPDVIVARLLGFGEKRLLRFSAEEKRDPDLARLFS